MAPWIPLDDALTSIHRLAQHDTSPPIPGAEAESLLLRRLPADVYHADRDALSCSLLKLVFAAAAAWLSWLRCCLYLCTWWSVIFLPGIRGVSRNRRDRTVTPPPGPARHRFQPAKIVVVSRPR